MEEDALDDALMHRNLFIRKASAANFGIADHTRSMNRSILQAWWGQRGLLLSLTWELTLRRAGKANGVLSSLIGVPIP